MKKVKNNLDTLLENLLNEADPVVRPTSMIDFQAVPQDIVSLDQVIDRYLVQYEREAIPSAEIYENNINKLTKYLLEQEEVPGLDLSLNEPENKTDNNNNDLDLLLGTDDDDQTKNEDEEEQKLVIQTPKINLGDFTRNVARLVNNYQSLIDFKSIILNRAKRYIQNNYNEATSKEMMEMLKTSYDLEPVNMSNNHLDNPEFSQPRAGVTGPVSS